MNKLIPFLCAALVTSLQGNAQCITASFGMSGSSFDNDTVCIGSEITLTDLSTVNAITWLWFVDNNMVDQVVNPQPLIFQTEGIHQIKLFVEDATGLCSDDTIKQIVVLGHPDLDSVITDAQCFGDCNGAVSIQFNSLNADAYTATWNGGAVGTATDLCPALYTATISDVRGCTFDHFVDAEVMEPSEVTVDILNGLQVVACPGNPDIQLMATISGGTPGVVTPYLLNWTPGTGLSNTNEQNPLLTPLMGNMNTTFALTAMDGNGCTGSDAVFLQPTNSQVMGNVLIDGAACTACEVRFLKYDAQPGLWIENTTSTDGNGDFDFGTVAPFTEFRLMADPDNDQYPDGLQTYYAGAGQFSYRWEESASLSTGCGTTTDKTIEVLEATHSEGECTFHGQFVHYNGPDKMATEEDPIPLIDVVVERTPPGSPQAMSTTNENGEFEFEFMPSGNGVYTFYINYPGVPMLTNYEITVGPNDTLYTDLIFCLSEDSTSIDVCFPAGIAEQPQQTGNRLLAYPNPSSTDMHINAGQFEGKETSFTLLDAAGRQVWSRFYTSTPTTFSIPEQAHGIYLLIAQAVEETVTQTVIFTNE